MDNQILLQKLQDKFGDKIIKSEESYQMLTIEIDRDQIIPVISFLKEDSEIQMNFLTDLCGIHYPDNEGKELGMIYHLHSFVNNIRLRVKSFFPIDNPDVPTLTGLYKAANWQERETYDFYGINFVGHPDLRRILNVDEMDYFPLRKEYRLEDGTRTDKDDRYFGREGNEGLKF